MVDRAGAGDPGAGPRAVARNRADLPAADDAEKTAAFALAYRALRAGPEEGLRAATLRLCGEAGIEDGAIAGELCLSGGELRALAGRSR